MSKVSALKTPQAEGHPMLGKYCVIRTYSAGVHIGIVELVDGQGVLLKNARRLWKWEGAFTLSEVSQSGVAKSSRIADEVPEIYLTQAVEFLPCSDKAKKSFEVANGK